jgi:hypothetical protein
MGFGASVFALDGPVDGEFWPRQIGASATTIKRIAITGSGDGCLVSTSLLGTAGSSALTGFGMTSSFNIFEFGMGMVMGCSRGFAKQLSVGDIEDLCAQPLIAPVPALQIHL